MSDSVGHACVSENAGRSEDIYEAVAADEEYAEAIDADGIDIVRVVRVVASADVVVK